MATKNIDALIAQSFAKQSRIEKDNNSAIGDELLNLVALLFAGIKSKEDAESVGIKFAFASTNKTRADKGDAPLKSPDEMKGFVKHGAIALMRVAAERDWSAKFLANIVKLHNEKAVKITNLLEFGRRVFGGKFNGEELKPVTNLPSVDTLKAWRKNANAGRRAGKVKREDRDADYRVNEALDWLAKCDAWLPVEAREHGETAVRELKTVADMLKAAKAKKPAKEEKPAKGLDVAKMSKAERNALIAALLAA